MLIDVSYFTEGPRHIQDAPIGNRPDPNAEAVRDGIEAYICAYQEPFLVRMLGASLGNKVHSYLVCQDEGDKIKVNSIEEVCAKLRESFADYVFYYIIQENNTQATMTGIVRLKCANDYVAPIGRQVMVWNRMVDRNRLFAQWCNTEECSLTGISTDGDMLTKINTLNI